MGYRESIVAYCRENIGASYDYTPSGGVEGRSYNCSYLSTCAYRAAGLEIPHWQGHQNGDGSQSDWVWWSGHWTSDPSKLRPGDLVFFGTSRQNTGHVAVVSRAGSTPWIIDSTPSRGVAERELPVAAGFVGGGWPLSNLPDEAIGGGGAPNNANGGRLDTDGNGGYNTVLDMQHALGTDEDGFISSQDYRDQPAHWAMEAVEYRDVPEGSYMVKVLQRRIGADDDGYWGHDTTVALQSFLIGRGYSCGDSGADGLFGHDSVRALQRYLNDGGRF